MNLEQALKLREKLIGLEGIIARRTREYIWKVLVAPKDNRDMELFKRSVQPSRRFDPRLIVQPYVHKELTVYFFLKKEGSIVCREYEEFLLANDMEVGGKDFSFLVHAGYHPTYV